MKAETNFTRDDFLAKAEAHINAAEKYIGKAEYAFSVAYTEVAKTHAVIAQACIARAAIEEMN